MNGARSLHEQVLESAGQAVLAADLTGHVIYWNDAAERLFGYTADEAIGQSTSALLAAEAGIVDDASILATVLSGDVWTGPFDVRHKDGTTLHLLVTDSPLRDDSGGIVGIVGVSTALADLRAADQRLGALETVVEALADALLIVDVASAEVIDCNTNAELLMRIPRKQIVGTPVSAIVGTDRADDPLDIVGRVRRGVAIPQLSTTRLRGDGSLVSVNLSVTPIRNAEGDVTAAAILIRDTTDVVEAEKALRLSEERLRRQFNDTSIPQAVVSIDGTFVEVNAAMADFLGHPVTDLVGADTDTFVHPDDRAPAASARLALAAGDMGRVMANRRYTRKDGSVVHGIASEVAVTGENGEPLRIGLLVQDVTDVHVVTEALARERATFHRLGELASEVALIIDRRGIIRFATAAITTAYGHPIDAVLDRYAFQLLHPSDVEVAADALRRAVRSTAPVAPLRVRVRHDDGSYRWAELELTNLLGDAVVGGVIAHLRDAREAIAAEERIHRAQHRYDVLVDSADEGVMTADIDGTVTFASRRAGEILRADPADIVGTDVAAWLFEDDDWLPTARESLLGVTHADARYEVRVRRADGDVAWLLLSVHPLSDSVGGRTGTQTLLIDITHSKMRADEASRLALYDALTGLANRTLLADRLRQLLGRQQHDAVAVLHVDIDDFRRINESLGGDIGDLILVTIAEKLEQMSGPGVTVARHDDDEFVLLLPDDWHPADAMARAEAIRVAVGQPMVIRGAAISITVSIGVAIADGRDAEALLGAAESAMQLGRAEGGDRVALFDDIVRSQDLDDWRLRNDLHEALRRDELSVHYQPLVHLASGHAIGAEALLRWQHPTRGSVSPDDFIPAAERSRLILALGEFALREACRATATWLRDGSVDPSFRVSVNLSTRQLVDPDLFDRVQKVLADTGLPPASLCLEVTETALMADVTAAEVTLRRFHALGVKVSIDDFGTGYSSLLYLRRLPVDHLKVDKSFVSGLGSDSDDSAIVAAVVGLADVVGVSCIAEGVETVEQADFLRTLGCTYAQGFLFSTAVPEHELAATLRRLTDSGA
jgi:diguanylate cyclase (GGDEF)-like protein/PAS domain S-box-containing protein